MAEETIGQATLRSENVERVVKGFALQNYTAKQLVMTSNSNSWSESYFKENPTDLTGGTGSAVKGIPRLAAFPYGEVSWEKVTGHQVKHGMEGVISWEDALTDNVDVIARTLLRIARAVTKSVDDEILSTLTDSWNGSSTEVNVTTIAGGYEWDSATVAQRLPLDNIFNAIKEIQEYNYNPLDGSGSLVVSPHDAASLLSNSTIRNAGEFYTDDATRNGKIGKIAGLKLIMSNSVTADYAVVLCAQVCGTWKSAVPLTVVTIPDAGINYTIRAWEIGVCQLTNPRAISLITNTQK